MFLNDKRHGIGIDKENYIEEYKEGKRHGKSTYYYAGKSYTSVYEENKCVKIDQSVAE